MFQSTVILCKLRTTGNEVESELGGRGIGKSGSVSSVLVGRLASSVCATVMSDGWEGQVKGRWWGMHPLGIGGPIVLSRLRTRGDECQEWLMRCSGCSLREQVNSWGMRRGMVAMVGVVGVVAMAAMV